MTPTDASERERQRAWLKSQPLHLIAHNILETMDADAEKIRALEAMLKDAHTTIHGIAVAQRFDKDTFADAGAFMDWAQSRCRLMDSKLSASLTQSPRSEAGEDK